MNSSDDNPTTLVPVSDAEPAQDAKPARRRRAPKAESAEPSAVGDAGGEAPLKAAPTDVAEGDAPAPKPARKRKPAAAKAAAVEADSASEPAQPLPVAEPQVAAAAPLSEPAARVHGDEQKAEGSSPSASEADPQAADAPRSSRNRRRNRRDRQRGEAGGEGAASAEGRPARPPAVQRVLASPQALEQAGELFAQLLTGEFDVEESGAEEAPPAAQTVEMAADSTAPEGAEVEQDAPTADAAAQADAQDAEGQAHRRVLQPEPDAPKLHKVLAQAGVGSRRDMEALILDGQITVNGEPAHIGQRISFGDQIKVKGKPVRVRIVPPPPRLIAYHKPVGEVVTHDDPEHRPTVFRRLPRLQQGKWQSVGRLDINTEGLLLFTNSGELANQLMHPRFGVEREYAVRVLGTLTPDTKSQLLAGVPVDGQTASFQSIEDGGGEGANHWYRVVITEGRNREVRKLFDSVGLTVSRLIRIRYGTVVLPRGLKRGVWVDLSDADVRIIRQLAGMGEGGRGRQEGRGGASNERQGGQQSARGGNERNQNNNRGGNQPRGGQGPQQGRNERNGRGGRNGNGNGNGPGAGPRPQSPEVQRRDDDFDEDLDFDPSKIPNPLEQTFDKRFVQKPRGPAGGAGFGRGGGGFGPGGSSPARAPAGSRKNNGPREPDPLQTSLGYLGADAYHGRKGGGGRGGNRGGGGGGGFGGGGGGRRGGR